IPSRLPLFTLFPYTTLFRSHCISVLFPRGLPFNVQSFYDGGNCRSIGRWPADPQRLQFFYKTRFRVARGRKREALRGGNFVHTQDRKSTRLNSSHLVISYAV